MPFLEKHKALLLTISVFLVLLLVLYNWHLGNNSRKNSEFLVDLEAFSKVNQEKKEVEKPKEQENKPTDKLQTHRAFNQNSEAREVNFNKQLNKIFEKNSAAKKEVSENSKNTATSGNYTISKSNKKAQQQSDGDNSNSKISTKAGSLKNSSISFNLLGRNAVSIPNPIYTCDMGGKIVINIQVNKAGRVTETSFNKASSTSDNKCLVDNALLYASEAKFTELSGKDNQPGTITYHFKP
ncbi:hypothetical protein [Zunongwangia sp.]|uniref:hypothetical protein n=1 Tax=Zunongwangia sp. TaxID=1965325 RepID=UPI003AA8852B